MCNRHPRCRRHHRRHRRIDVIVLRPGQKVLVKVKKRRHHRDCY